MQLANEHGADVPARIRLKLDYVLLTANCLAWVKVLLAIGPF